MQTLYFTRYFTKGNLKGIYHNDHITFINTERAVEWLKGIEKNTRKLDYIIVDKSFQKYARD